MTPEDIFSGPVTSDLFNFIAGRFIGEGTSRRVYQFRFDLDYVLKYEAPGGSFQNIHEHDIWRQVEGTEHEKWFAPCRYLSPCGMFLVQKHCRAARPDEYPENVPNYLTDLGRDNFGIYKGNFVARDYGYTRVMTRGLTKRMKKAYWEHA